MAYVPPELVAGCGVALSYRVLTFWRRSPAAAQGGSSADWVSGDRPVMGAEAWCSDMVVPAPLDREKAQPVMVADDEVEVGLSGPGREVVTFLTELDDVGDVQVVTFEGQRPLVKGRKR